MPAVSEILDTANLPHKMETVFVSVFLSVYFIVFTLYILYVCCQALLCKSKKQPYIYVSTTKWEVLRYRYSEILQTLKTLQTLQTLKTN